MEIEIMPIRKANVKIENNKVVFSQEIINYFESLRNEETSEWIDKYFDVLSDPSNFDAEKYNIHHIIPCCTFKDKNHKTRIGTALFWGIVSVIFIFGKLIPSTIAAFMASTCSACLYVL